MSTLIYRRAYEPAYLRAHELVYIAYTSFRKIYLLRDLLTNLLENLRA
jgi:hypothetical protein